VIDELKISEALITELGAIASIHRLARQAAMPWLPDIHTPDEDRFYFERTVFKENTLLVARNGGRVLGFAAYKEAWLNQLYVSPEHWRLGIGGRLLEAAQKTSKSLQLWTFQRNTTARWFYAARGFSECEQTDGRGNEEKEPDVRMVWRRL
jgi:GNAT superfamily N-acetyltransferase